MNAHDRETPVDPMPAVDETGVQRAVVRTPTPADDAGKLNAIYERVVGIADIAETSRAKQDQILRENIRIGASLEGLREDNASLKRDNAELLSMNRKLFREIQEHRYNLERRIENMERRTWNLESRVDALDGKGTDVERQTPDPATPDPER